MKAKVFVFLFCFLFLFTSISNIFAAELKKVRFSDEYKIENYDISMLSGYKYIFAVRGETYTEIVGFNDLSHIKYEYSDSGNALRVIFLSRDLTKNDKAIKVQYLSSDFSYFYTFKFQGGQNGNSLLNAIPLEGDESSYLFYTNFDIVFDGLETFPSMTDDTIGDPNSRLQISHEYNEDNTECKINATIKDGSFTDKIFYSNYMPSISGGLITKKAFPIDGITITDNQSLFFQAEDKDGNIIATNSISIYNIGKLSPDLFNVTFNFSKGSGTSSWVDVFPSIADNQSVYYDLYYKISSDQELIASSSGHYAREFTQINNNEKMNFQSIVECKFTLYFEVRNSVTGNVALTKSYDIVLDMQAGSGVNDNTNGGITGGTVNGEPVFDFDFEYNIDWSLPAAVENIKNFFETSEEFLNLVIVFLSSLPMWIIMPIYTFLILAGIIFVFHAIRG